VRAVRAMKETTRERRDLRMGSIGGRPRGERGVGGAVVIDMEYVRRPRGDRPPSAARASRRSRSPGRTAGHAAREAGAPEGGRPRQDTRRRRPLAIPLAAPGSTPGPLTLRREMGDSPPTCPRPPGASLAMKILERRIYRG